MCHIAICLLTPLFVVLNILYIIWSAVTRRICKNPLCITVDNFVYNSLNFFLYCLNMLLAKGFLTTFLTRLYVRLILVPLGNIEFIEVWW